MRSFHKILGQNLHTIDSRCFGIRICSRLDKRFLAFETWTKFCSRDLKW